MGIILNSRFSLQSLNETGHIKPIELDELRVSVHSTKLGIKESLNIIEKALELKFQNISIDFVSKIRPVIIPNAIDLKNGQGIRVKKNDLLALLDNGQNIAKAPVNTVPIVLNSKLQAKKNRRIYFGDDEILAKVIEILDGVTIVKICKIKQPNLYVNIGIGSPDFPVNEREHLLGESDMQMLKSIPQDKRKKISSIILSFISNAGQIQTAANEIHAVTGFTDTPVTAKIETINAVGDIIRIASLTNVKEIMIGCGDLGVDCLREKIALDTAVRKILQGLKDISYPYAISIACGLGDSEMQDRKLLGWIKELETVFGLKLNLWTTASTLRPRPGTNAEKIILRFAKTAQSLRI